MSYQNTAPLCHVVGVGHCLPNAPISNAAFIAKYSLESTPEWIESRTGITQRYMVNTGTEQGKTTATLATAAAREAIANAGLTAHDIHAVLVATCTPDLTFPSVAALVQAALDVPAGTVALDVNAACSGFLAVLGMAQGMFATQPNMQNIVVIGAETFSNVIDTTDRGTSVLFGDGAGALVLSRNTAKQKNGLLYVQQGADGRQAQLLHSGSGVAVGQKAGVVQMQGAAVYKHAVRQMGDAAAAETFLAQSGHKLSDVTWLVPHQANARIIEAAAQALNLPTEKVILTVNKHANTSAASIPLALYTAATDGRIKAGDLVLLQAFGAGFTWGMASITW